MHAADGSAVHPQRGAAHIGGEGAAEVQNGGGNLFGPPQTADVVGHQFFDRVAFDLLPSLAPAAVRGEVGDVLPGVVGQDGAGGDGVGGDPAALQAAGQRDL
jgi:hypothetical protein